MLKNCLGSLENQSYDHFQIIVVDNGSSDNSRQVLEELKKKMKTKLHVIYNEKNSGFAGGVNIGIQHAMKGGFSGVALFNNDAIADKAWLKNLAHTLDSKPEVGIATGLLLHEDGETIDSTGDWYSLWGMPFPRSRGKKTSQKPPSGYVFGGSGGASLYRMDMLKQIGLFDERFFAYYEDVDISFRAQLAGWKAYYNGSAIAYHKEGETSKKVPGLRVYMTFKNLPLLFFKNVPLTYAGIIGPRFFLAYWLIFFNTIKKGSFWYALRGFLMSLYYMPSSLLLHWQTHKMRESTDHYLSTIFWPSLPPEQSGLRKFIQKFNGKYDG